MKQNVMSAIVIEPQEESKELADVVASIRTDAVLGSELYVKTAKVDLGGE
ncbi:MAG: hypothetical protein HRU19_19920 [Pseudobacteriovorax sp.]|nr:hypothetical protein [Pseudobacteriovorax sp.]